MALFDEGDEVLVLTPVWPLILGILSARGVVPVQVPVGTEGWPEPEPETLRQRLLDACTDRTAGLYVCDPNNPGGFVTPPEHVRVLREVAEEMDLWMMVDVVYKDLIFDRSPWQVPELAAGDGADRLFLTGSFSKSHVLAGHRAGFLVGPEAMETVVTRVITHCPYHASTSAQEMAVAALAAGPGEIDRVRHSYRAGMVAARTGLETLCHQPQAGAFLFLDLRELVHDEEETMALLVRCAEAGVALAPGSMFGDTFARFARLCYTTVPPATVAEGVGCLNDVLTRWRSRN
jgi:aspartate/methionine/tyrosine aminotransferase